MNPDRVLRRYVIDIVLIVLCLGVSFTASKLATKTAEQSAVIINMSGKQRLLSQRVSYLAHLMVDNATSETATQLKESIDEFAEAHTLLTKSELTRDQVANAYFSSAIGYDMDRRSKEFIDQINGSLTQYLEQGVFNLAWLTPAKEASLLSGLNQIVSKFEQQAKDTTVQYDRIQTITFTLAIIILIFEAIFIFRPALQNIRRSVKRDRQLVEIQSNFLTKMSHEMRTPLNAIIGFSEAMKLGIYGKLTPEQAERVSDLNESGNHLLSLVNDLLDLNRVSRDKIKVENKPLMVRDFVDYAVRSLESKASARSVTLIVRGVLESMVVADRLRAKQCLINLIDNAIKFSPKGQGIIIQVSEYDDMIDISVSDKGPGIPSDQLKEAIRMFGQVKNKAYVTTDGLGIDLALTSKLMDKQGGAMDLQSVVDEGTTVTLKFQKVSLTS